ncbi:MAG: UDP-N-acetylmuramoyl-L-alanine--D-glutamate ligase [Gammaproteobacteria bacterium]|nr:UDP-N-acetylmuramoyl-L-alanine--D-glutamate ligase [Gammaproteobacteria bacterium]
MKIEVDSRQEKHTSIVVGLGKTGLSCARYLARLGDRVIVTDSRERPPGLGELRRLMPEVETRLGGFDEAVLGLADRLVVSPGVSLSEPFIQAAARRNVAVTGDIAFFAEEAEAPLICITGSNGKSTVTMLVAAMLRAANRKVLAGGNLGVPALDLLRQPLPDFYVLELSSFQLESTTGLASAVAAVLNLSADHIDRHGHLEAYANAKARIFESCGIGVFNRNDPAVAAMAENVPAKISFGADSPAVGQYGVISRRGTDWLARGQRLLAPVSSLKIQGRHNVENVLAALAIGKAIGLERETMLQTAQEFRGLPHRTQWVSDAASLVWINDSKGTNVGASVAAIESVRGRVVLIAGGDGKNADFAPLAEAMRRRGRAAVLMGKDAAKLEAILKPHCATQIAADMDAAVVAAMELAQHGDTVLLSPACSSLDMYNNYEARGDAFVSAIKRCAA